MTDRVIAIAVSIFAISLMIAGLAANMMDLGWRGKGIWDEELTPAPMSSGGGASAPTIAASPTPSTSAAASSASSTSKGIQPSTVSLRPDDLSTVDLGRRLYASHCASCHGADLEGQPAWRERRADGKLPAPPHDESGHTWHHPDSQLFELTKYGPTAIAKAKGTDYQSDMPGYDGVLTDAEIVAVLSYIKSRWPGDIRRRHDDMNAKVGGS